MKAFLTKFLARQGEHHVTKSTHHAAMAEHFGKLAAMHKAKSDMEDTATLYRAVADAHSDIAAEHTEMADECVSACKALKESHKVAGFDDDLSKAAPLPDGLRVVHDAAPKMVPRAGMQPPAPANVPEEFRPLVAIETGDEA